MLTLMLGHAGCPAFASTRIKVAGSSTVFPVANAWATSMENASSFDITIEGGGSSSGARRVCAGRSDPSHVDIGDMSRDWKSSEAVLLDDGYTFECTSSKIRVTQIQVGVDGLAVVVGKNSRAHDCLTSPDVGGLTLAMLHWIFTNWTNSQLTADGVNLASAVPNDDGDGIKEWSDLSSACDEVPINAYGPGSDSGTFDFFAEKTLCTDCFGLKAGKVPEDFQWCSSNALHTLEQVNGTDVEALQNYMQTQRPLNCYMSSESDYQLVQWLSSDAGGIGYFGYSYYSQFASRLTVARVASDRENGVLDTKDAKVEPSTYTITDGSYSVYKRKLYMNVDNEAWDRVHPYLSYGFSPKGQKHVATVGYVPVNAALLAKMKIRIEERGNEEADYISVAPSNCPVGTELSAIPYVNQFGTDKVNYTCSLCPPGRYKFLDTPTPCSYCPAGKYADQPGLADCLFCEPGYEPVNGVQCQPCQPGSYKKEVAAATCSLCEPGTFTNRSAQADCEFCLAGFFSIEGSTGCTACPKNEIAPLPKTGQCTACGAGFSTSDVGSTSCFRCKVGAFRFNETSCVACPGRKTTAYQGAATVAECICPRTTYLVNGLRDQDKQHIPSGTCSDCGEGLDCALGSDFRNFEDFASGLSEPDPLQENPFPVVEAGYFAKIGALTQVYKCGRPEYCPGGLPGSCVKGRIGLLCGHCTAGQKWTGEECENCGVMDSFAFLFVWICLFLAVPIFYYFMNSPVSAKASTLLSTTVAFGMTLTLLQTVGLVGFVGMKWPPYMQSLVGFVSIFMLDLEALNFDCFGATPVSSYVTSVLFWPGALLWLFLCAAASGCLPKRFYKYRFVTAKAVSTAGQIFQMGFTIMSKTALMPFMCYTHPNGKSSVLEVTDVICWEGEEHIILVIFGVFMTGTMILYWCTLVFATRVAPLRSAVNDTFFLAASRFLFFRFRPDYWWYGTWFILRGPLLTLPIVIFTDLPQVQLFIMTAVLEIYMVIQLVTWPWKTPIINLADGLMSMLLILLLAVGSAFLDALEGQVKATYSVLAVLILGSLYSVTFVLLCLVLAAFFHKSAMGSHNELTVLTLGKPPSTEDLVRGLEALCFGLDEADYAFIYDTMEEFNVYDRRMLASILTTLAPYFDNDERMRMLQQFRISTHSISTYQSETNSERSSRSNRSIRSTNRSTIGAIEEAPKPGEEGQQIHSDGVETSIRSTGRSTRLPSDEITKPWFMDEATAAAAHREERMARIEAENEAQFQEELKTTDI
ncbi:Protein SphX [Durusdinium trenchii]|uniref:Protein SphX n=1 Tax=Durusdinium trenchii TaxID=1381693 RepID=A0ABP0NSE8_9DINO